MVAADPAPLSGATTSKLATIHWLLPKAGGINPILDGLDQYALHCGYLCLNLACC